MFVDCGICQCLWIVVIVLILCIDCGVCLVFVDCFVFVYHGICLVFLVSVDCTWCLSKVCLWYVFTARIETMHL